MCQEQVEHTYLQDIVAHLEHDYMLHSQILLNKIQPACSLQIFKRVLWIAVQSFHHVLFEMLEQVHFALEFFRMVSYRVVFTDVDCAVASGGYVVQVAVGE